MISYREYLQKEKYSNTTIKTYELQVEKFTEWYTKEKLHLNLFSYQNAIEYVQYLQSYLTNVKTINHKINITKIYFEYLIEIGDKIENPFTNIRVQGEKKNKLLHNLLSSDELEDLYYSYDTTTYTHSRIKLANKKNKVITGLLVYQGLLTTDLNKLQLEHLEIYKGKIHIPRGNIGNARTLELKPWQVAEFIEYINEVRPKLLPKSNQELQQVFIASKNNLSDTVYTIMKKLKKINHKVENIHQIRASVIVNWLSKYNLREVQILAGHKYISSTEKYQQEDIKQLQEIVNQYHPLK